MESSIKAMFNQTAPVFIQRSSIHDLCSKQIASLIKKQKWIKPTDSIMDFGCGVGSFTFALFNDIGYARGVGVDSSEKMIQWFNKEVEEKKLGSTICSKCEFLDNSQQLDGERFDVIVSLKAMHHIPDPFECVTLLKQYLKPHGRIIIADLKLDDHSPQYHRSIKEPPCCHGFTEEYMEELLRKAGLKPDVHVVNCYHYLECLDMEEAKKRFESLPAYMGDICKEELSQLPPMLRIGSDYFDQDVFPFVVACGELSVVCCIYWIC